MAGGPGNSLGARAMYLGVTIYRIHGTNAPDTIGHQVSSGCIRMVNDDVTDLYSRVNVGTKVVVLPMSPHHQAVAHAHTRSAPIGVVPPEPTPAPVAATPFWPARKQDLDRRDRPGDDDHRTLTPPRTGLH